MRKYQPKEIPRRTRERMFGFWCEHERNTSATARHFNKAIRTIQRVSAAENWPNRADEIDGKIRKRIDGRIVTNEVSNIRLVRTLKKKMAKELFERPRLDSTVRDFIALCRYEDELVGNLPESADGGDRQHLYFDFSSLSDADRDQIRRNLAAAWGFIPDNRLSG